MHQSWVTPNRLFGSPEYFTTGVHVRANEIVSGNQIGYDALSPRNKDIKIATFPWCICTVFPPSPTNVFLTQIPPTSIHFVFTIAVGMNWSDRVVPAFSLYGGRYCLPGLRRLALGSLHPSSLPPSPAAPFPTADTDLNFFLSHRSQSHHPGTDCDGA